MFRVLTIWMEDGFIKATRGDVLAHTYDKVKHKQYYFLFHHSSWLFRRFQMYDTYYPLGSNNLIDYESPMNP